jgi:hypothetical protein
MAVSGPYVKRIARIEDNDNGRLRLTVTVDAHPSGMVEVDGQPVGNHKLDSANVMGWLGAQKHFAARLQELLRRHRARL